MLSLLAYIKRRTLTLPPDDFVDPELIHLINDLVCIVDIFLRTVRISELADSSKERGNNR